MDKEFVPYEQALALKELGFHKPCFGVFDYCDILHFGKIYHYLDIKEPSYLAPTFSQAFRWFREKCNISSYVDYYESGKYDKIWYFIIKTKDRESQFDGSEKTEYCDEPYFKTYEEAELECLKKLIEIVKK